MKTNPYNLLVLLLSCCLPASLLAGMEKPPAPAPARKVTFTKPVKEALENGLSIIVVERPGLPLVCARMVIKNGAEVDSPNMGGLAEITAALLTKGTESRTAPEIAEAIEILGASIESGSKWDSSFVKINTLSTQLPKAMELLADLVRHPAFKDEEIERLRKQVLDNLGVSLEEPGTIARFAAAKVVFGSHPYGHPSTGTPESIGRINRDSISRLHRTYYRPSNAILVLSGDITLQQGLNLARKTFGDWTNPPDAIPMVEKNELSAAERRVVVIDVPGAGQAAVLLGKVGIQRTDGDYFTGEVANGILGGGYSSRLNEEIRVKRGLSYGAGSSLEARRQPGPFLASAQTKNRSAAEVAGLMTTEIGRLSTALVGDGEIATRKAALIGEFARHLETNEGFGAAAGNYELYGLPVDSANTFAERVNAVTAEGIQAFAKTHLQPDHASVIIVGEAKAFRETLAKTFPNIEVIPGRDLDLNEPALKRKTEKADTGRR